MIYTVTWNPSLDYIVFVDNFTPGKVNRTKKELLLPGGKGINVSIVLRELGLESRALGFAAGFTGREIKRLLAEEGVSEELIWLSEGQSRINVKLRSEDETEVNGGGPEIGQKALDEFYRKLDGLRPGDVLVLAGSIPSSMPENSYQKILEYLKDKEILTAVDASGPLLKNVLPYHPFLVKPNLAELGELFRRKPEDLQETDEIIRCAGKLRELGAKNVLVSRAGDGAVLAAEDGGIYESGAPKGNVINSVGAGDSMVAGFLYGYLSTGNYETALRYGICAGSASAFSEHLATRREIENLKLATENRKAAD